MSLQDASIPSKASVYVWASPPTHLLLEQSCQTGPKGMLVLFLKQHQSMMLVQRQSIPVSEVEGPPSSFTQRGSACPPAPPGRGLGRGLPCNVSRWTRCWADIKRLSFGVSCRATAGLCLWNTHLRTVARVRPGCLRLGGYSRTRRSDWTAFPATAYRSHLLQSGNIIDAGVNRLWCNRDGGITINRRTGQFYAFFQQCKWRVWVHFFIVGDWIFGP